MTKHTRTAPSLLQQSARPATADDDTLLPLLYALDRVYGWSQGMRAITHTLVNTVWRPPGSMLEVGCGAGNFLHEWQARHPQFPSIGVDRHGLALQYAQQPAETGSFAQADLQQLPFADSQFGLIVALDAFDQRAVDLHQALRESWRLLQPNGLLVMRVSAHPWLHSSHDDAFNTGHRYQQQELTTALRACGFQLERVTYANSLLALPVIGQRLLQRWQVLPFSSHHSTAPVINTLVARLLGWEARLLQIMNLPFGISLYVLARKRL